MKQQQQQQQQQQSIDNDIMEVVEEESSPHRYTVNIKHVHNKDMTLVLNFKSVESIKKLVVKKKNGSPYMINSFIFYTSFLSKADIKLKKESKSWQLMGALDPVTKKPVDIDGYQFRKLIEGMEAFHKKLVVYEDDANKIVDKDATTSLRKRVIEFAKETLRLYYCHQPDVHIENLLAHPGLDKEFLSSCEKLLTYSVECNFREKTERFRVFLERHDFMKRDDAEAKGVLKRRLTTDMVNDD
uniref:ORF57 pp31/39K n=1 Tax=Cydia pomonella granulosis virus TaxID=28289 RepID=A0A097P296_GVCP|nr:ORF57 pp31/39K [Cydia pomonella granulovirus]